MAGKSAKKLTAAWLRKIGVPAVLIPGLIVAAALGWTVWQKLGPKYVDTHPSTGVVQTIVDGDTFAIQNNTFRLIGVNAPDRGDKGYERAKGELRRLINNKTVFFEYDRYQDDKYGRILAWVWVGCESTPTFLPADYMHLSGNASNPGLLYNPPGCRKGKLVQEELLKKKLVQTEFFADRGELKYQARLQKINN